MKEIKTLKQKLGCYFLAGNDLDVSTFINVETVLYLLRKTSPFLDPSCAYVLLRGYQLTNHSRAGEDLYLMQQARRKLICYASRMKWEDDFAKYCDEKYAMIRLYDIQNGKLVKMDKNLPADDRENIYDQFLREEVKSRSYTKIASAGKYVFRLINKESVTVDIPSWFADLGAQEETVSATKKTCRDKIQLSFEDLLQAAEEMKQIVPDDYCHAVLKANRLHSVIDSAIDLTIEKIVNVLGMVGAGKSTLMKVLTYYLSKNGYRVVIVLNTVSEVIQMMRDLSKYKLDVSPLIGKSNQEKYVCALKREGDMYIDEDIAQYLSAPCALNGLVNSSAQEAWEYGERPCYNLRSRSETSSGNIFRCPLFHVCPGAVMLRKAETSSIVVTTVAGLSASYIGCSRHLFLDEVLSSADVVMFDECDRVQSTLDDFFAPNTAFNDFIYAQADGCAEDMRKPYSKIQQDKNERAYYQYARMTSDIYESIVESISNIEINEKGKWYKLVTSTFSALTILEHLKEEGIDERLESGLRECAIMRRFESSDDNFVAQLSEIVDNICMVSAHADTRLKRLLNNNGFSLDEKTFFHVVLLLKVIAFDRIMHHIDDAAKSVDMEILRSNNISDFLQARFIAQQKYLPAAPMGNMFGMMYSKSDEKLKVYRQYANGRFLMLSMPWLRVNEQGEPIGPHAILMSGSSYAPGSLQYNVNVPVNYILESPKATHEYLKNSIFRTCGAQTVVSGGGIYRREENLRMLISEIREHIESECDREGKLLFIVNSYDEARIAWNRIKELLSQAGRQERCAVLIRDDEKKTGDMIKKNEIEYFGGHPAKILIAPASVICRGYNIVDDYGNSAIRSVFFLVRPMSVPDDISLKIGKLNGYITEKFLQRSMGDPGVYANDLKNEAGKFWGILEQDSGVGALKYLSDESKRDVVATVFITLIQIFGRAARVKDMGRIGEAPRIYFADGAFNSGRGEYSFDIIAGILEYLEQLFQTDKRIAETLYGAFYCALKEGHNETETIAVDGIYSENYYD